MIRAAAKNHADVAVVVDADDYAARAGRARGARRRDHAGAAQASSPPRPMRAPPPTTRRSPTGSRSELGDPAPDYRAFGGQLGRSAALRREPAPGGGVLSHAGAARRRRHRAAAAGQAALLQQHQRHRRGLRMRRRVRSRRAPRPAPSSSTPIRAASPKAPSLLEAYRKALRLRSGLGLRRHRRAQPHARRRGGARHHGDLHRGHHRARRDRGGDRASSAAKKNLRLLLAGGLPDPRAAGLTVKIGRRRPAGAVARQRGGRRHARSRS